MKQYQERNYAPKVRKVEKGDLGKYRHGNPLRTPSEASCSNSLQQGGESKKEEVKGTQYEIIREKDVYQTHQERRQGIQESNQGRCEVEKTNTCKTQEEKMKKQSTKEKKHEAKESKAYEKKEDMKEKKSKNKSK